MQDKEFDQLFRDRLGEAELEPSTGLWAGIEQQLRPERKKSFPFYWMAAAIAVLVTAAALWFNQPEKVWLQGKPAELSVAKINAVPRVKEEKTVGTLAPDVTAPKMTDSRREEVAVKPAITTPLDKKDKVLMQPIVPDTHLKVVVEHLALAASPVTLTTPDEVLNDNEQAEEKKGIRNFGDLVNYVVDRVDKRDQKIVRFRTDDDDESSLVAINIGFIKFNPKKHK